MFILENKRKASLGSFTVECEENFFKSVEKEFKPMMKPKEGEWLFSHKEKLQSYDDYMKSPFMNLVTPTKKTIYLLPFGEFDEKFMNSLVEFCEAFYPCMYVKILPNKDLLKEIPEIRKRENDYGKQYVCEDILNYLKTCIPHGAYCVMGITLKDLYPGPNWNYVYGWATYKARVGIFSFARWNDEDEFRSGQINWKEILYPSIRTMVHEIGHMFGITHCVYYRCLMNGYNHILENYENPLEMCPICLRKLYSNIKCKMMNRYSNLMNICLKLGFKKEVDYYQKLWKISGCFSSRQSLARSLKKQNVVEVRSFSLANKIGENRDPKDKPSKVRMLGLY